MRIIKKYYYGGQVHIPLSEGNFCLHQARVGVRGAFYNYLDSESILQEKDSSRVTWVDREISRINSNPNHKVRNVKWKTRYFLKENSVLVVDRIHVVVRVDPANQRILRSRVIIY